MLPALALTDAARDQKLWRQQLFQSTWLSSALKMPNILFTLSLLVATEKGRKTVLSEVLEDGIPHAMNVDDDRQRQMGCEFR